MIEKTKFKNKLMKLYKEYLDYLERWNKKVEKEGKTPIPRDGVYEASFEGFMEWISLKI